MQVFGVLLLLETLLITIIMVDSRLTGLLMGVGICLVEKEIKVQIDCYEEDGLVDRVTFFFCVCVFIAPG